MKYLAQASYTAEACAAMIKNPQNRGEMVRQVIEKLGGRFEGFWFAFGDYDLATIFELPDNVTAAAFSLAVSAGGALKALKTTQLMTAEEAVEAMKKAAKIGYRPPTS
ncbi:MAG: GYD domain-containing protein [Thermodesulfovibrionales bacterium]